ncbi:hypothetical protein ACU42Y_12220 [Proteus mirabilis]
MLKLTHINIFICNEQAYDPENASFAESNLAVVQSIVKIAVLASSASRLL